MLPCQNFVPHSMYGCMYVCTGTGGHSQKAQPVQAALFKEILCQIPNLLT